MRSSRRHHWIVVLLAALACAPAARAAEVQLKGKSVSVRISPAQASNLDRMQGRLTRAGLKAYVNLYRWKTPQDGPQEGATIVATVKGKAAMSRWLTEVGAHTIGFVTSGSPTDEGGSGYLRIGKRFWPYGSIQGSGTRDGMARDVAWKTDSEYTEASFEASPAEIAAANAYCTARSYHLLHNKAGTPIVPEFDSYSRSGFKVEGCAGASTSMLSPAWREAFRRSLPAIQAFAAKHPQVKELRGISATTVDALDGFAERIGARQWTSPKYLITKNYVLPTLGMITTFNAEFYNDGDWRSARQLRDPLTQLLWSGTYRTIGGGAKTIPDLPVGKKSGAFVNERLSLAELGTLLGSASR